LEDLDDVASELGPALFVREAFEITSPGGFTATFGGQELRVMAKKDKPFLQVYLIAYHKTEGLAIPVVANFWNRSEEFPGLVRGRVYGWPGAAAKPTPAAFFKFQAKMQLSFTSTQMPIVVEATARYVYL
jgi:hypothetical protein